MVKDSKYKPPRSVLPRPKRDRTKATLKRAPVLEEIRADRLMMRMHSDLVKLLDARAREAGESRSRFIEKLLVAFLRLDPRNPRIDPWGRIDPDAPPPIRTINPHLFGEKWGKFKRIYELLGFNPPPDEWLDDEIGHSLWAERAAPDDTPEDIEEL